MTWADGDSDWTRRQSWGVLGAGDVGEVLGVGVGLGDELVGFGLGLGVGDVDDGSGLDELPDGDGDAGSEVDAPGAGVELPCDELGEADDELACALLCFVFAVFLWSVCCAVADAVSTAFFGIEPQTELAAVACALVDIAPPTVLAPRKRKPAIAPSAAGLTIRALTGAPSLR